MIDLNEAIEKGQIERYYNNAKKSSIGGTLSKSFLRVDASLFGDLWDKIENNETSAATYINDVVKNGERLSYVSCMLKKSRNKGVDFANDGIENEILASKLADIFQIPCAYTLQAKQDKKYYGLSVDIVPYRYQIQTLTHFCQNEFCDIEASMEELANVAFNHFFHNAKSIPDSQKIAYADERVAELLFQFFFKKYIICDGDTCTDNMAILRSKNDFKVAPIFDSEFAFSIYPSAQEMYADLEYLRAKYPAVYKKIVDKAFVASGQYFEPLSKMFLSVCQHPSLANAKSRLVIDNLTNIMHMSKLLDMSRDIENY